MGLEIVIPGIGIIMTSGILIEIYKKNKRKKENNKRKLDIK
jgi:hypothetical protein